MRDMREIDSHRAKCTLTENKCEFVGSQQFIAPIKAGGDAAFCRDSTDDNPALVHMVGDVNNTDVQCGLQYLLRLFPLAQSYARIAELKYKYLRAFAISVLASQFRGFADMVSEADGYKLLCDGVLVEGATKAQEERNKANTGHYSYAVCNVVFIAERKEQEPSCKCKVCSKGYGFK